MAECGDKLVVVVLSDDEADRELVSQWHQVGADWVRLIPSGRGTKCFFAVDGHSLAANSLSNESDQRCEFDGTKG